MFFFTVYALHLVELVIVKILYSFSFTNSSLNSIAFEETFLTGSKSKLAKNEASFLKIGSKDCSQKKNNL